MSIKEWNNIALKINFENGILPHGEKITVDKIIHKNNDRNFESLLCTSFNNSLIICDKGTSSENELI